MTLLIRLEHYIIMTKKKKKGIYGNASTKQIKELNEEGIETQIFPWIDNNNN